MDQTMSFVSRDIAPGLRPAPTAARLARWDAVGLVAIGVGLVAVAVLGPLANGAIDYRVTETLRSQTIGLDAVSLFVVAPLCLVAAVLTVRGHVAGPALALGIGAYTAYMFVQYVLGPDYAHLPGNNERLFPVALALFGAGWVVALAAWLSIDVERLPRSRKRERRLGRLVLPLLGFLAFFRYVPALADAMSATPEEQATSPDQAVEVIRTSGLEIAYECVGEGPPLVFVHGAASDARLWRPQVAALADEAHRVDGA
jgi:hypothetical protein